MDPQAANQSGQSPDGTPSDNSINGVPTGLPMPPAEPISTPETVAPSMPQMPNPQPMVQAMPATPSPGITPLEQVSTILPTNGATAYTATVPVNDPMAAQPGVFVGGAAQPMAQFPPSPQVPTDGSGSKKRWAIPLILVVVLLAVSGGGYVFGVYLPNTPSNVYQTSLKEAGDAINTLINYSGTVSSKSYKSYAVSGSINSTGSTSFTATVNGSGDTSGNAKFALNADVMGEKLSANVDTIHISGSTTPDVYLQANGVKPIFDSLGLNSLDSLDGQWIDIDHTLISSTLSSLNQDAATATKSSQVPSVAQVRDAATKVEAVNKMYLFSTNTSTAVLANERYLGKTTLNGRSSYHYQVGYNKAHLETYLSAVGTALDSSSLNSWSKLANSGKNLSQVLDIDSIKTSVASANSNYVFDMWVDAKTKLPQTLQFIDPSDSSSVFTISQNYTGGTTYPFAFGLTGKDSSTGEKVNAKVNFTLNTATNKFTAGFDVTEDSDVNLNANVTVTPSAQTIKVTPPTGAEPALNVLSELGLSGDGTSF